MRAQAQGVKELECNKIKSLMKVSPALIKIQFLKPGKFFLLLGRLLFGDLCSVLNLTLEKGHREIKECPDEGGYDSWRTRNYLEPRLVNTGVAS